MKSHNNDTDKFVVVLDAGHGGKDPGNLGNGYKEKDIALKVVLAVGKELEKNPSIKVIYTRKTDKFIDLFVRGKIANKAKANLFVSVHCDSHHTQAYGAGTFVLGLHRNKTNFDVAKKENAVIFLEEDYKKNYEGFDPNSQESAISILLGQEEYLDQSIYLASLIQKSFVTNLKRKDRRVKQAGFIVLHQTVMPSVLVELGFLTHKKEGAFLNSKKGQQDMSKSISSAILKYKKSLDSNSIEEQIVVKPVKTSEEPKIYNNINFKVQIAASSRKLATRPYNFKGLEEVSLLKEGSLYKYFYGDTSDYNKITEMVKTAKKKGYSTCFIVAFKDDKKIPLAEALKTTSN
ncbi:MAG: N-acetylmuramoyl-L-alanine amidase [Algibacter sp.]